MKKGSDLEGINWRAPNRKAFGPQAKRTNAAALAWRALTAWRFELPSWVPRLDWGPLLSIVLILASGGWVIAMIFNLVAFIRGAAR